MRGNMAETLTFRERVLRRGAVVSLGIGALAGCSSGQVGVEQGVVELEEFDESNNTFSGLDCDISDIPELKKGTILVDGRCDPVPEEPVWAYSEPNQQSESVDSYATGILLQGDCTVEGENIVNANALAGDANNPTTWVRVGDGYVPATWVHGETKLDTCEE